MGFNKIENDLINIINHIDKIQISNLLIPYNDLVRENKLNSGNLTNEENKTLIDFFNPRVQKLFRLKQFNDFIVNTTLDMLHLFYWKDFRNTKTNIKNINEYIETVLNISL